MRGRTPIVWPCGHSNCKACANGVKLRQPEEEYGFVCEYKKPIRECPTCRASIDASQELHVNISLIHSHEEAEQLEKVNGELQKMVVELERKVKELERSQKVDAMISQTRDAQKEGAGAAAGGKEAV